MRGGEARLLARALRVGPVAEQAAGGVRVGRQVHEREVALPRVVARARPGLQRERGGGRLAAGDDEQIAVDAALAAVAAERGQHRGGQRARALGGDHRVVGEHGKLGRERPLLATQVGDGRDLDAGGTQVAGCGETAVGGRHDDGSRAGRHRVARQEGQRAAREHDPRAVVVGEDQRLLDRAGREDQLPRAHLVQRVALPDRDEAVEAAERGGAAEDLDAGRAGALR